MPAPATTLALVGGRAQLTVARRDLGSAVVERVEVEWPGVKALPEGGKANGLRNRRGRLRAVSLSVDGLRIERRAAGATFPPGTLTRLDVALEKGRIVVAGRAEAGGSGADFTAQVAIAPGAGRKVRVGVEDINVLGTPPIPEPAIASAVLSVLLGPMAVREASPQATQEIDPLALALDEILVAEGWRLPESEELRMTSVVVSSKGIEISWRAGSAPAAEAPEPVTPRPELIPPPPALVPPPPALASPPAELAPPPPAPVPQEEQSEVDVLRRALDESTPGPERADVAQRLAAACERAGDQAGAIAALRTCIDNAAPGPVIGPAWRRIVELHARSGDPHAAARALIASADDTRTGASDAERAGALVAAAEILRRRLGLRDDASMLLERACALDPSSAEALEGLEAVAAEAEDHQRLAEVLELKVNVVRGRLAKKDLLVRLAGIYDGPLGRPDRARATHERALQIDPDFALSRLWLGRDAWARGDAAAAAREVARALETAPGGTAAIDLLANDEALAGFVAAERARIRLAGPGGAAAALALLRAVPPAKLSDDGLVLSADLAEREKQPEEALAALEELRRRARAAGHATEELDARLLALSGGPRAAAVPSVEELERQLSTNPADPAAAEALVDHYTALADPKRRAEALANLLNRAPGLSDERRKSLYATVGQSAEAGGDLERAEQAYWRAAQIEAEPGLRANYLTAHARVMLVRGEMQTAKGELEAALERAPDHVGALALLADLSYRTQDWPRARELYARLDSAPDSADVLSRVELVHRRAVLAQRAGDADEAEVLYREMAILNPSHAEARRALAELARGRGDAGTAAQRLEEVLRLLPAGATAEQADVRQRLGGVYAEMGEWALARTTLELVLAQDPGRAGALEILVDAYDRLDLPQAAAEVCGRLSRIYVEPARRAAALFQQAEILRTRLDNAEGALDAYLRSSDLDPHFIPARLRLVDHFWNTGDLDVVADLANDLRAVPLSPVDNGPLVVRLGIAAASSRRDRSAPSPFTAFPTLPATAARALAEAAGRPQIMEARGVDGLDPMLTRARAWAGSGEPALLRAMLDLLFEDLAAPGPAVAVGRLAELSGRRALAGSAYALAAFIFPDSSAARQLATLIPPGLVRPEAVRVGGPVDHPDFAGPARRALARLAPALLGFQTERTAPKPTEGSGLPLARAAELRRIGDLLDAPAFVVAPDMVETEATDDRRRLRVILTQPAGLLVSSGASNLADSSWSFIAARALETLRSGLWMAGLAGADGLARLFEGARAVLGDNPIDEPRARAVADWLRRPEAALFLGPPEERVETLAAIEAALASLPDWTALTRGAQQTRNRVGLIACADPTAALSMLKSEDRAATSTGNSPEARRDFLRRASGSDLLRFMFSPTYEAAFS